MIIGLLGKKGAGKDTTAELLQNAYSAEVEAFATPLKESIRILFDMDDEQLYGSKKEEIDPRWGVSPRFLFQYFGTDIVRNKFGEIMPHVKENFWVIHMANKIEKFKEKPDYWNTYFPKRPRILVISDVRFQNEVDMIKEKGGEIIKIIRSDRNEEDNHISEAGIDAIKNYDYEIENNGTLDEFKEKLKDFFDTKFYGYW